MQVGIGLPSIDPLWKELKVVLNAPRARTMAKIALTSVTELSPGKSLKFACEISLVAKVRERGLLQKIFRNQNNFKTLFRIPERLWIRDFRVRMKRIDGAAYGAV